MNQKAKHIIEDIVREVVVGQLYLGKVKRIEKFGAFVEVEGKTGLVHISELSEGFVKNPMDVVSVGDIVNVRVISVDMKRGRVSLSMKGVK